MGRVRTQRQDAPLVNEEVRKGVQPLLRCPPSTIVQVRKTNRRNKRFQLCVIGTAYWKEILCVMCTC